MGRLSRDWNSKLTFQNLYKLAKFLYLLGSVGTVGDIKDVLAMDSMKIIELLRGTIDPNQRKSAEEQLQQVTVIIRENLFCARHILIKAINR